MMTKDDATEQMLTKCSRFKVHDYRNHTRNSIEELEHLISMLEKGKTGSSQVVVEIIQTIITSIDRRNLWKAKGKVNEQQQLARMGCRLFKCLCQSDRECATNEQGLMIMRSILQWLRDDTDFHLIKSVNQDLHVEIYSCLVHYSSICKNPQEFLNELFSTSSKHQSHSSFIASCFRFHHRRRTSTPESLSIIEYSARLLIYLLESSLITSTLLINQILTFFLIYAPIERVAAYLVNQTDLYSSIIVPLFSAKSTDYFVQCVINETAQSQIETSDRVFVFTYLINLLGEFVLHQSIDIQSSTFVPMFKHLFDALVECGTTVSLWYLVKCLSNLLTSTSVEINPLIEEMNRTSLISSIINYTSTLIDKSTLGHGQLILKELHNDVLASCLSILYNISELNLQILPPEMIIDQIRRRLFQSDAEQVRLRSCLLYSNLLTEKELQSDQSSHHLSEELFSAIRTAFYSDDYYFSSQISLFSLVNCLKKLCTHQQFQQRIGKSEENIELLFQILRRFHSSIHQQEEIQVILESIWFLSFDYSSAMKIHRHDKYFALLVQLAETNPNERIQQAAKGILWQLRQTISIHSSSPQPPPISNSSQHIMFSYNHDSKEMVNKICQSLQNSGYRTWMDVDDMHGSTLECMAHAVEQSSVILICMSEKYKQSPNCQSEAEYAYRLGKPFVPILFQAKYKPDGWLGMLLGTRLYIDFTKRDYESNYRKLVNEIEIAKN